MDILGPGVWEVLRPVRELVLSCTFDSARPVKWSIGAILALPGTYRAPRAIWPSEVPTGHPATRQIHATRHQLYATRHQLYATRHQLNRDQLYTVIYKLRPRLIATSPSQLRRSTRSCVRQGADARCSMTTRVVTEHTAS